MPLLTENQMSKIFDINFLTLKKLIHEKKIPCSFNDRRESVFDPDIISGWVKNNPLVNNSDDVFLKKLKTECQNKSPEIFTTLQAIDLRLTTYSNAQKNPKLYSLMKRPNKRYGFLYYVRYIDKGKLIPSKWNTHTNILEEAEKFAQTNRNRILASYYSRHSPREVKLYEILEEYYKQGSSFLENDKNRNRIINEKTRSVYQHFMTNQFLAFLRDNNIKTFVEMDIPLIARFQNHLLAQGLKPQSVNRYLGSVRAAFSQLLMTGVIKYSAFESIRMLKTGAKYTSVRGCHDVDAINRVFTESWDDLFSYLLCLMIYTTGLRNSEIARIKVSDLIEIEGSRFINVSKSKTENGKRLIPLHDFVYQKIKAYCKQTGKTAESYIFSKNGGPNQSTVYKKANILLGGKLGLSEDDLKKQKITFYSGRHFWKTLMNSEGLGEDIEEFFMGHKTSGDVAKNYNHKDKQGKAKLLEKAREVFTILDRKLFGKDD
jgi:integrase